MIDLREPWPLDIGQSREMASMFENSYGVNFVPSFFVTELMHRIGSH